MSYNNSTPMSDASHPQQQNPTQLHKIISNGQPFIIDSNYALIRSIGSGAYGVVISALDENTGLKLAIKKVPNAFNDEIDAKRILREIKLLKSFNHENVIGITDMIRPDVQRVEDFNDVYIVSTLMETDLHRIIYSKQDLTQEHVQYFLYQILRGLKYIHSANVLHRDLKPSNLLVNGNCDLKICDLGLARGILPTDDSETQDQNSPVGGSIILTEYVVTRWYRAPEIMLSCDNYNKAVDVWSVGCIFAELIGRKPFFPGEDYINQLTLIAKKMGKPNSEDLSFIKSDKAKRFMMRLPTERKQSLSHFLPNASASALDLLEKMLQINPEKRCSCTEALAHPFLSQLANPDDEPDAGFTFDFSFEEEELNRIRLQELIWEEIGTFKPECLPVPQRQRRRGNSAQENGGRESREVR